MNILLIFLGLGLVVVLSHFGLFYFFGRQIKHSSGKTNSAQSSSSEQA